MYGSLVTAPDASGARDRTLARWRLSPMRARDPGQEGRVASSLELFFDLVFVISVSVASAKLHEVISAGDVAGGLVTYAAVFFAIWWAWMNFSWFGTAFDTDDWLYRVITIFQMGGVLVFASGIAAVFDAADFRVMVTGYVIMRVAMVAQWLRASIRRDMRAATLRYAIGIAVAQALWVAWLAVPHGVWQVACMIVLVLVEISIPVWAELRGRTMWHPHHITERYGAFTLIVLGESLLASSRAIFDASARGVDAAPLWWLGALALIVTASLWWVYFWPPHHRSIGGLRRSLRYGYVHYVVFAAAGAVSVGIGVEVDRVSGDNELSALVSGYTLAGPVALFLLAIWWIALRDHADRVVNTVIPLGAVVVLLDPLLPTATHVTFVAVVLVAIVAVLVWRQPADTEDDDETADALD